MYRNTLSKVDLIIKFKHYEKVYFIPFTITSWIIYLQHSYCQRGKIKYGKYIYYEGNVENGKMKGQGTLYIKAKIPGNEGKVLIGDEITGIFENNQITSCSIKFGSGWSYEGDAIVNILKEKMN